MDSTDQPIQPDIDGVDEAIEQAKAAAQHLRDVAPDAIDEVRPHEEVADAVSPTEVSPSGDDTQPSGPAPRDSTVGTLAQAAPPEA